MRVLVTGGAGFIGANLCRRLVDEPGMTEVRVLDDLSTGRVENLIGIPVHLTVGTILDPDTVRVAAKRVDAIVHLAAVPSVPRSIAEPLRSHQVNTSGTLNVLEAARANGNAHVVLASSSSIYGGNPAMPKSEELQPRPLSPYAVSKLAAEQYAMSYAACYDLPVLPFRFFNVFGPLQAAGHAYAAVVPAWLHAALNQEPLRIAGDGHQSRDFTSVRTVTEVITAAVLERVSHSPVNLAFGTRTSLLDLAERIEDVVGHPLQRAHVEPRVGDVAHSQASSELVRTLFPDVRPAELTDELRRTWDWMRSNATTPAGAR